VQADPDTAVVCAFGDSITEGVNSTLNGGDTWPDVLSRRLHSAYGNKIAVVKQAISGNTVTSCPREGGTSVNGPSAGDRLDRDVFGVAGLRYVIWLEGINDLGACLVSAAYSRPRPGAAGHQARTPQPSTLNSQPSTLKHAATATTASRLRRRPV
jgi:lysophospholipase L1-like esterase